MDDGLEMAVDLDRTRVEREVASTSSTVQGASARLAEPRRHAQVAKQIVLARNAEDAPDMLDMRSEWRQGRPQQALTVDDMASP